MAAALGLYLLSRNDVGAVLGLGGGGNTSMVTEAMRRLPIGVPKLMVSTMASGNVAPYVGPTDIMMMHAVADVAGLNAITRTVIGNAAQNGFELRFIAIAEPALPRLAQPFGIAGEGRQAPEVHRATVGEGEAVVREGETELHR